MKRLALLSLLFAACTSKGPRCGSGPVRMEIRDGSGALQLRVTESPKHGELDLCDSSNQRVGLLVATGDVLTLYDHHNAERLHATRDADSIKGPSGAEAIRVRREGTMLRVLQGTGVPYGTVSDAPDSAVVSGADSSPLSRVTRRDADSVLSAQDGTVQRYLLPGLPLSASGVMALEALSIEDRVFLAAYLGRGRLQP